MTKFFTTTSGAASDEKFRLFYDNISVSVVIILHQDTLTVLFQCWEMIENANRSYAFLTHWGRVTHICVGKLTSIGSDNGLSPGRRQAIIWTNAGILLIRPLETNFIEILIRNQTFSFKKMHLKMSSAKWRLFYLGLNVLNESSPTRVNLL